MASLLMMVGVGMTLFDFNLWFLAGARFVYGLAIGALTVFVPKFISETTPTELKGPYGGISQIMCCVGILVPSLLALPIPHQIDAGDQSFLVQQYWRVCWGIPIVIALLQLFLIQCFFNFESPQTLKETLDWDGLSASMRKIYKSEAVQTRILQIDVAIDP